MFLFGKVTPEAAVTSAVTVWAEDPLLRPGITMADKANAVNVNVASVFFIVDILYLLSLPLSEKPGRSISLEGCSLTKIYICRE
jgi:hypothetical protein